MICFFSRSPATGRTCHAPRHARPEYPIARDSLLDEQCSVPGAAQPVRASPNEIQGYIGRCLDRSLVHLPKQLLGQQVFLAESVKALAEPGRQVIDLRRIGARQRQPPAQSEHPGLHFEPEPLHRQVPRAVKEVLDEGRAGTQAVDVCRPSLWLPTLAIAQRPRQRHSPRQANERSGSLVRP
jgi:hypothetical protein